MPTSKKRKTARSFPNPNRAVPRKPVVPLAEVVQDAPPPVSRSRDPAKPRPPEDLFKVIELPEPATYGQVLVALSKLDGLEQEVMIAQRLAQMPHPGDPERGIPVHIERMARGPWAHNLRKLGLFCIPELATHELVAPDGGGTMAKHTAATTRKIGSDELWQVARAQNPEMAALVDGAETEEQKRDAARVLINRLPVAQRLALQRLLSVSPSDLEPS